MVVSCASSIGYLNKFDLYLGQKKDVEVNLAESVVMQLSKKTERDLLHLVFWQLF